MLYYIVFYDINRMRFIDVVTRHISTHDRLPQDSKTATSHSNTMRQDKSSTTRRGMAHAALHDTALHDTARHDTTVQARVRERGSAP